MPDYIRLQRLLNAAARIITNLGKYDHITDAMKQLHWLPIESRIQYKVLVLVHACVHNIAPPYLSSLFTSYVPSREMRSSGKLILHQPIPNNGDIWQAIIRIWWAKIMEQFGYKIAYNSLTRVNSILFLMSLVEGIMCHSIHYFTIVFYISLLQ